MRSAPGGICSIIPNTQSGNTTDQPATQSAGRDLQEHDRRATPAHDAKTISRTYPGRPDWLGGYGQMVTERVPDGWSPYFFTVMFNQLFGRRPAIQQQMLDEVQRIYSTLAPWVNRKPRNASPDKLPLLLGALDLPVHKRKRCSAQLVRCNDGLHFNAVLLVPPRSRLKTSLVDHFEERAQLYRGTKRAVQHIDVRPIVDGHDRTVDYVFKTILKRRIAYDDGVVLLPRARAEL
jgi:hypothetical protein